MHCSPRIFRGNGKRFMNMFSIEDIDRMLCIEGLRPPFLALMAGDKCKRDLNPIYYLDHCFAIANPKVVLNEVFNHHATLVIQHVQHLHSIVAAFINHIEQHIYPYSLQANCYLAPPNSKGVAPHVDQHHTFLLQLSGKKNWLVWKKVRNFSDRPHFSYPNHDEEVQRIVSEEAPVINETLYAGDLIFIPRGYVHTPYTTDDVSLHLTMGIVDPDLDYLDDCLAKQYISQQDTLSLEQFSDIESYYRDTITQRKQPDYLQSFVAVL